MPTNGGWTKWLVGVLWTIVFVSLTTIAGHVINNEIRRVADAKEIRAESLTRDEKLREKFEAEDKELKREIVEQIKEIKNTVKSLDDKQDQFGMVQVQMFTMIKQKFGVSDNNPPILIPENPI